MKRKTLKKTDENAEDDADAEEGVVQQKERKGKPITHEQVLELEYKALVSEGQTLYYRNEYRRAIEAFTKALNSNRENLDILIDRANCYVQIGNPKAALLDINTVLNARPEDTRAILAKAEAFFSMGEFEFALVFFEKGAAIRKDMIAFRDGITKARHLILDSINVQKQFQPDMLRDFASYHKRKPVFDFKEVTPMEQAAEDETNVQDLLPEKVPPLILTNREKSSLLGELALDYQYLVELREEVINSDAAEDDRIGKKEDQTILKIVNEALAYLDQRAQFWSQQRPPHEDKQEAKTARPASTRRARPTSSTLKTASRPKTARATRATEQPNYQKTKLEMWDQRHGA